VTGPALFCVGSSPEKTRDLIEVADALLARRSAVVASVWQPSEHLRGRLGAARDPLSHGEGELDAHYRQRAREAAGAAAEELSERGWHVRPRVYRSDQPAWRALLALGAELRAHVIVAGTSDEQQLPPGGLGGQIRGLAHNTDRPLLAVPPSWPAPDPLDPVLVAYDGSASASAALDAMPRILARRPAVVASAWQTIREPAPLATIGTTGALVAAGADELDRSAHETARHVGAHAAAALRAGGWHTSVVAPISAGSAWPSLVAEADEADAAVVVAGTRNRSRLSQVLLGSVAEGILRHAGRPVLLAPECRAAGQ